MLKVNKNNIFKIKSEIDCKINLYSYCIDCGFKKLETNDEEEVSDLLKSLNYI